MILWHLVLYWGRQLVEVAVNEYVGTSTTGWTVNDCDYLCDGTADDVEINAAIQALPAEGGEIVILDGTYNITATITMNKDNVTLSGNGNSTVLKRMWDSTAREGIINVTSNYTIIKTLKFDGNMTLFSAYYNCGIYVLNGSYSSILENTFQNNYYSIYQQTTNYNILSNNLFCNGAQGVRNSNSNNIVILQNIFINFSEGCCNSSNSNYVQVIGNNMENSQGGIDIFGYGNSVIGNFINLQTVFGIKVQSDFHTVSGNVILECTRGIFVTGDLSSIVGNTIMRGTGQSSDYSSSQYTIITDPFSSNNLFVGNNIMGKNYTDNGTNNTWANNKYN